MPDVRRYDRRKRRLPALRDYYSRTAHFGCRGRAYHNASDRDLVRSLNPLLVSPEASPERRTASDRRTLHDHEAGAPQMLNQPLGDDLGHDRVGGALVERSNSPHDAGIEVRSSAEKDLGAVVPSPSTAQFSSVYQTEQWPPGSSSTLESVGHFL